MQLSHLVNYLCPFINGIKFNHYNILSGELSIIPIISIKPRKMGLLNIINSNFIDNLITN